MAKARLEAVEQQLQELKDEVKREQKDLRLSVERGFSEFGQMLEQICRKLDESAPNPNGGGAKEQMRQGGNPANAQNSPLAVRSMRSIDPLPRADRGPRLEIPKFRGDNPMTWIIKCERYFLANPMTDREKMLSASLYMEGGADVFYTNYIEGKEQVLGWERFAEMVVERFFEEDLVEAFISLKQESSVGEYWDKFEELKYFMVKSYPTFTEEYFVQCFLSGLKQDIKVMVKMLKPTTLDQAIHLAKLRESSRELTVKDLQAALEDYANSSVTEKDLQTSLHALDRRSTPKTEKFPHTINLIGKVKNISFSIVVVSGIPQSLLDRKVAERIGCKIEYTNPYLVTATDGATVNCNFMCRGFKWEMGNHTFTADVGIMKMAGCDMFIGMDVLRNWGGITFDFEKQRMIVEREGYEIILQGETDNAYQGVLTVTCDNPRNR